MNYDWQERVIEDVDKGESTLLQMPRRAGKTEVVRQLLRRRVAQAEQGGVYQSIVVIVPNFNHVPHYLSVLNDMFRRIGVHGTRNDRMVSGRNFTIRFISARDLNPMRGLRVNLIIVDNADMMDLTNEEIESIFRPCLIRGDDTILITATNRARLFKSVLESAHWNRDYEYIFPTEDARKHVAEMLQWAMKNLTRENIPSLFEGAGLKEELTLHTFNKSLKYSLTTY